MSNQPPLPPLDKEALDGHKEEAAIHRDQPLPKTCFHKNVGIISSTEIRCSCGVGWTGEGVLSLYEIFRSSTT